MKPSFTAPCPPASGHCGFGAPGKVTPFILIFQACYLCFIPLVPNNRPRLAAGRFVAEEQDCPSSSRFHPAGHRPIPAPHSALKEPSPKLSPATLNVNKAAPSPHTQRATQPREHGVGWGPKGCCSPGMPRVTNNPQLRLGRSGVALALSHVSPEIPAPGAPWRQPLLPPSQPFQRGPLHHGLTRAQGSSPALPPTERQS